MKDGVNKVTQGRGGRPDYFAGAVGFGQRWHGDQGKERGSLLTAKNRRFEHCRATTVGHERLSGKRLRHGRLLTWRVGDHRVTTAISRRRLDGGAGRGRWSLVMSQRVAV